MKDIWTASNARYIGTAKSAALWQIRKLTYDANGDLIDIAYEYVWNNRVTYSYS